MHGVSFFIPSLSSVLVFGSEVSLPLQHIYGSCFCISSFTMSLNVVVIVLSCSRVCFFVIPLTAVCKASLFFTITQSLFKLTSTESMMPSNHLILSYPDLFLPSLLPSIMIFSSELALCIKWPKYWSFKFSISEYSGLISFRIDWFDLAVQGTLKSLSNTTV